MNSARALKERRLIINADDFGLTQGINKGILEGFKDGIITSASLLTTMPAFEEAVNMATENRLDIGLHVSLTAGRPCSQKGPLRGILKNGEFIKSYSFLFKSIYGGRVGLKDLKREMTCQIRKILDHGLTINHINGHQHVLMLPGLFGIAIDLMKEFGIPFIRIPAETRVVLHHPIRKWEFVVLAYLSKYWQLKLKMSGNSRQMADHFLGLDFSENMSLEDLTATVCAVRPGISELMCHPGYDDAAYHKIYDKPFMGEKELAALNSSRIRDVIKTRKIELIGYGDIIRSGRG